MKKVLFVLVVAFISETMIAQADTAVTVPPAVVSAFNSRFPSAQLNKWQQRPQGYIAVFRQNGQKLFAYYSADGSWIGTEFPIHWSNDVPQAVKQGWKNSNYAGWKRNEVKRIDYPDSLVYVLYVDNSPTLNAEHMAIDAEKWALFFDQKGNLVRKEIAE